MGLDVTAYSGLKKVERLTGTTQKLGMDEKSDMDGGKVVRFYGNPLFPDHHVGIETEVDYGYDEDWGFRAGSYSGYGDWREALSNLAGYSLEQIVMDAILKSMEILRTTNKQSEILRITDGRPFGELVFFSDCEGLIGPDFSRKLAKDFADFQEKADATGSESFKSTYNNFRMAFELAAKDGGVEFH